MVGQIFTPTRTLVPPLGVRLLHLEADSELSVAQHISDGLPPESLEYLAKHLGISVNEVLTLTGVKSSTYFERKRNQRTLSREASSCVYRLAKTVEAAEAYFDGNQQAARRWLNGAKIALGGKMPLEFARTPEGSDYVIALLGRMAHGIPS